MKRTGFLFSFALMTMLMGCNDINENFSTSTQALTIDLVCHSTDEATDLMNTFKDLSQGNTSAGDLLPEPYSSLLPTYTSAEWRWLSHEFKSALTKKTTGVCTSWEDEQLVAVFPAPGLL